jgi:restriction endonuclease S subunit
MTTRIQQSKMQKISSIPKLRFPGFLGEWAENDFLDIFKAVSARNHQIKSSDILVSGKCRVVDQSKDLIAGYSNDESKLIKIKPTIVFGDHTAILKYVDFDFVVGADGTKILNNKSDDCLKFLFYSLQENPVNPEGYKRHYSILKNRKLLLPTTDEQQKIAEFLGMTDEWIENLRMQRKYLEKYKKGMMQKIFAQELRFKNDDGKDFAEWEEKELNKVAEINPQTGKLPESFVYIDLESVERGALKKENKILLKNAPSRAQRLLNKYDILFQTVRPYQKNNLLFNKEGNYVASTGYAQIRNIESANYIFQLLHTNKFVNKVLARCIGTSYPAINSKDLGWIKISIPQKKEQQKIAEFLASIDNLIESKQQQITQAELWKKGLMQGLFV